MKVPLLPLHLVTSKTLREKLDAARNEGKSFKKRQLEVLLNRRVIKPIRTLAGGKKKNRKTR